MDRDIIVREVGLRDGLQIVDAFFPTKAKLPKGFNPAAAGDSKPDVR